MCGIAAILLQPQTREAHIRAEISQIFTRNLVFNEARGTAATGLAILRADGQFRILKRPLPASKFVQLPEYQALLSALDSQTTLLLGHTRRPTKGKPDNNANNHPIIAGHVLGVHNGHIDNDDDLFERYHYPRQAEVDSEIIFRLLDDLSPHRLNERYLEQVCSRLQLLRGQFTFLAADLRAPSRLIVLKHQNPLCLHYHQAWNALIFSSRYLFLRKAFGRAVVTEILPHSRPMLFDAARLAQLGNQPRSDCALF